jgi:ATP-dependent DNA helicase RecG
MGGTFDLVAFIERARAVGTDVQSVEVKTAAKELPKDIVETVSAFANGSGGVVVCGISEKDGFTPVEGFDAKRIADALSNVCAEKLEPPVRATVDPVLFEGSPVVVALIPEAEPYLKPCYVKARTPYDGSFIRTGDGDRKLSRYEVDRILENRRQPCWDRELVVEAGPAALDASLVRGLLERERANSPFVFGGLGDEDALLSMGALARAEDGSLHPTLAGLMALGRHPQQFFPRLNVTFAAIPGRSKADLSASGARFIDSRTVIGPVPVMVSETLAAVRRNMRVSSYVEGAFRIDVPDYPEVAVREALANALMHRDYSPEGRATQVQVNMYEDRIEITNPGGLFGAVTVDRLGEFDVSASRNQTLSRLLESTPFPVGYSEAGYVVENKGTGYFQIERSLAEARMRPPEPKDDLSTFRLTMYKRDADAGAPGPLCPEAPRATSLNGTDEKVVAALEHAGEPLRARSVMDRAGLSRSTALRSLAKLVDLGRVRRIEGTGRSNVLYEVVRG